MNKILIIFLIFSFLIDFSYSEIPKSGQILQENSNLYINKSKPQIKLPKQELKLDISDDKTLFDVKKIKIKGVTRFFESDLLFLSFGLEGKKITIADLQRFVNRITKYYRDNDYMVAYAYIPEQDISNGKVTIRVLEGELEKINIINTSTVSDSQIRSFFNKYLPLNTPLKGDYIKRAISNLSVLSGIDKINISLSPGQKEGYTVLTLFVNTEKSYNGMITLDNLGNQYTGTTRLSTSLSLKSPLKRGDVLSLSVLKSSQNLYYGNINCNFPITNIGLYGGLFFEYTNYELSKDLENLGANGNAEISGFVLKYDLYKKLDKRISFSLQRESRDLVDRIDSVNSYTDKSESAYIIKLNAKLSTYKYGGLNITLKNTIGKLNILDTDSRKYDIMTAQTNGDYNIVNLGIKGKKIFDSPFSLLFDLETQYTNSNLDSYEKFSLGGPDRVSSYSSGEGQGDEGIFSGVETQINLHPNLVLGIFANIGRIKVNHDYISNEKHTLSGAGFKFYWQMTESLTINTTFAWKTSNYNIESDGKNITWFNINKFF